MSDETPKAETELPTTEAANPDKPARAPKAKPETEAGDKPAKAAPDKAAKKEKPPALEDKPFQEFINQDFLPGLTQMLAKVGIPDVKLDFAKRRLPIAALGEGEYWQVMGHFKGDQRQFSIIFSKEDIQAAKFFTWADNGAQPTIIESFMIDERKVNLDLLLLYTAQRLNGQKWLVMN